MFPNLNGFDVKPLPVEFSFSFALLSPSDSYCCYSGYKLIKGNQLPMKIGVVRGNENNNNYYKYGIIHMS